MQAPPGLVCGDPCAVILPGICSADGLIVIDDPRTCRSGISLSRRWRSRTIA